MSPSRRLCFGLSRSCPETRKSAWEQTQHSSLGFCPLLAEAPGATMLDSLGKTRSSTYCTSTLTPSTLLGKIQFYAHTLPRRHKFFPLRTEPRGPSRGKHIGCCGPQRWKQRSGPSEEDVGSSSSWPCAR